MRLTETVVVGLLVLLHCDRFQTSNIHRIKEVSTNSPKSSEPVKIKLRRKEFNVETNANITYTLHLDGKRSVELLAANKSLRQIFKVMPLIALILIACCIAATGECDIGAYSGFMVNTLESYSCYIKVNDLDGYRWLQELTFDRVLTLVKHPYLEFDNNTDQMTYITETPFMLPGRILIIFGRIRNTEYSNGNIAVYLTNPYFPENAVKLTANWTDEYYFSQLSFLWHILIFADHIKWYSNLRHIGDYRLELSIENFTQIIISGNLRVDVIEMGFLPQVADIFEAEEICYEFNGGHLWSPENAEEYNFITDLFKPERLFSSKKIQEEVIGTRALENGLETFDEHSTEFIETKISSDTVEYGDCFAILRWKDDQTLHDEIIKRECYKAVVSFICKISMTRYEYEIMLKNAIEDELLEIDEKTRVRDEVRKERSLAPGGHHWTTSVVIPFDTATVHMEYIMYAICALLFAALLVVLTCFMLNTPIDNDNDRPTQPDKYVI